MSGQLPLQRLFAAVPSRYDVVNLLITLGLDRRWRREAARRCLAPRPGRVLDLCCGTADLAIGMLGAASCGREIFGLDFSRPMLAAATRKARRSALHERLPLICGDAARLPLADCSFDCVGISFGFRNLIYRNPHAARHLREIYRILRPGGKLVVVESSQPRHGLIRRVNHLYLQGPVAWIGALLSNRRAYRYLAESAVKFPDPGQVKGLLLAAGFRRVEQRSFLLGAVGLHEAVR